MRTYFAIVSLGRSGSTLLERMLASHPDITCLGEEVSPHGIYGRDPQRPIGDFIRESLFGDGAGLCGFKMPFDWIIEYPDVFGAFSALDFKIVYLTRNNKLDQWLSMRLAQETGIWGSNSHYGDRKISTNFEELRSFFAQSQYADIILRRMIGRFPNTMVSFEGIMLGQHRTEILDFLGVRNFDLTTNTVRSRTYGRRDIIVDFESLSKAFEGTPYAWFFTAPEFI